jgi:drug/metabolite transporter (DMT)-like permease
MTATTSRPATAGTGQVWTALATVYLVWGSTYLGIAVLIETMPPLLGMGTRFFLASAVLATVLVVRHGPSVLRITPRELTSTFLLGFLLLGMGLGGVTLAEAHLPSGLVALLVAAMPLWVVVFRRVAGQHLHGSTVLGVLVGFAGICVLVLPGGWTGSAQLRAVVIVLVGSFCWALGTFLSPSLRVPSNAFVLTVWEMLCGGVVLSLLGALRGEAVDPAAWSGRSLAAWFYLGLIGSAVGFTAFVWLLAHAPVSLVSTYAYVNPVVAVALGALVLSEPVTRWTLLGGAVVLAGVALVVRGERPPPAELGR